MTGRPHGPHGPRVHGPSGPRGFNDWPPPPGAEQISVGHQRGRRYAQYVRDLPDALVVGILDVINAPQQLQLGAVDDLKGLKLQASGELCEARYSNGGVVLCDGVMRGSSMAGVAGAPVLCDRVMRGVALPPGTGDSWVVADTAMCELREVSDLPHH